MYLILVVVGWLYVALMMAVAEASHADGTIVGGFLTFVLYGAGPVALVAYLGGRGTRRRARGRPAAAPSGEPDAGGEASGDAIAPVRKEP